MNMNNLSFRMFIEQEINSLKDQLRQQNKVIDECKKVIEKIQGNKNFYEKVCSVLINSKENLERLRGILKYIGRGQEFIQQITIKSGEL